MDKQQIGRRIRKWLFEIFETLMLPSDLAEIEHGLFKFSHSNILYGVKFEKFTTTSALMIPDTTIRSIVDQQNNKYSFRFGIIDNKNKITDNIYTNKNQSIKILNYILAITKSFIEINGVTVLAYFANDESRKRVYRKIYEILFKNDYIYYTSKDMISYTIFFINKKILPDAHQDNRP